MRIFRCGCGLLSLLSLLPILLLLVVGVALFNDPHILPGPLGDFAADARGSLASIALGGEVSEANLSVSSIEASPAKGGSLTVTLSTSKTKPPTAKDLVAVFKALGGHLAGPLPLSEGPLAKVTVIIEHKPDGRRLVSFSVPASDLQGLASGKLSSGAFLKRVTTAT